MQVVHVLLGAVTGALVAVACGSAIGWGVYTQVLEQARCEMRLSFIFILLFIIIIVVEFNLIINNSS